VFSRTEVDRGTRLLVEALEVRPRESMLDLGTGYGPIGLAVAASVEDVNVVMSDVNRRAIALARRNARSNGLRVDIREGPLYEPVAGLSFHHVVANPPIRAGKSVVHGIVDGAPAHLVDTGSLWLVARTQQGAPSLGKKMREVFGTVDIVARGGGFRVLRSRLPGNP